MVLDLVRSIFRRHQPASGYPWGEGYIGPPLFGVDKIPFEVAVCNLLTAFKLDLADVNYLHLASISFRINGKWLSLQEYDGLVFEQSTVANNDTAFEITSLANGSSAFFSTRKESKPYVIIRFPKPVRVEAIRVVNRRDGLWHRARSLRVFGECSGAEWRCFYDGSDGESRIKWLAAIIENVQEYEDFPSAVNRLIRQLKASVQAGTVDSVGIRSTLNEFFAQFEFPIADQEAVEFFASDMAYSLAQIICFFDSGFGLHAARFSINMLVCHGFRRDGFKLYTLASRSLSAEQLAQIESDIEVVGQKKFNHPLIPAAHTFARPLSSYPRDALLDTIDAVFSALNSPASSLMLCYGTLLGFYRDNDFIAHDDDIDLLCITNGGRSQVMNQANDIVGRLTSAGFRAKININNRKENLPFVQVFSKAHKVHVDIFIAYAEADEIFLPMNNVKYSSVSKDVMLPVSRREFFEREYPVPAQIEPFLVARYGATWNVPDKHFRANEHGKR
ncbi:LicD family protein [Microbulbifer sp. MCCC 1A16149]|uniref:LicD family protein n=1 Tax=Microbulbifer sp. MCCC 1A16149 TaxID=3411322 RepID=UPI003D12867F